MKFFQLIFFILITGVAGTWIFGSTAPIEVVQSQSSNAPCNSCRGGKIQKCDNCKGFGFFENFKNCRMCSGAGHIPKRFKGGRDNKPCSGCRATGKKTTHDIKCTKCDGKGTTSCQKCHGSGKTISAANKLYIGYSHWERLLLFLKIPVNPNPAPQKNKAGEYLIINKYLEMRPLGHRTRVRKTGIFTKHREMWSMQAEIETINSAGNKEVKNIEFVVHNRKLIRTKYAN